MNPKQQFEEQGIEARRFAYDDHTELVADFGPAADASVDIVGETAIVVAGDEQYDIEVGPDARAFISNGVVTIEVNE
jgi:hypothetical protein